jgi:hypothetical protein
VAWELLLVLVLLFAALLWSTLYTSLSLTLLSISGYDYLRPLCLFILKRFSAVPIFLETASYLAVADNNRYCHSVCCCQRHLSMCTSSVLLIVVFCVFTPCSVVDVCQHFECTCCLHLQGEGIGSKLLLKCLGWGHASVT